jgi:hypothetical protein
MKEKLNYGDTMQENEINVGDMLTFATPLTATKQVKKGIVRAFAEVRRNKKAWSMIVQMLGSDWGIVNFVGLSLGGDKTITIMRSGGFDTPMNGLNYEYMDNLKSIDPHSSLVLQSLPRGSIIKDADGVLGQGANRNWKVQRTAKNLRLVKNKNGEWETQGASNYTFWPINKRTGDIGSWKNSKGISARSLHRLLKKNTDLVLLRYGQRTGDMKENTLSEPDKDYTDFLDSLSVVGWDK